jgi:hypothetical protein
LKERPDKIKTIEEMAAGSREASSL